MGAVRPGPQSRPTTSAESAGCHDPSAVGPLARVQRTLSPAYGALDAGGETPELPAALPRVPGLSDRDGGAAAEPRAVDPVGNGALRPGLRRAQDLSPR